MKKTNVTVACCALIAPLALCASAFAGPSENVVQPATQQSAQRTVKQVCYVVRGTSASRSLAIGSPQFEPTVEHYELYAAPERVRER